MVPAGVGLFESCGRISSILVDSLADPIVCMYVCHVMYVYVCHVFLYLYVHPFFFVIHIMTYIHVNKCSSLWVHMNVVHVHHVIIYLCGKSSSEKVSHTDTLLHCTCLKRKSHKLTMAITILVST